MSPFFCFYTMCCYYHHSLLWKNQETTMNDGRTIITFLMCTKKIISCLSCESDHRHEKYRGTAHVCKKSNPFEFIHVNVFLDTSAFVPIPACCMVWHSICVIKTTLTGDEANAWADLGVCLPKKRSLTAKHSS